MVCVCWNSCLFYTQRQGVSGLFIVRLMDKGKGAGDVASPIADLALAEYHQYGHLKAVVCSKRVNKRNEHYI